jgi:hypothetical protein
METPIIGLIFVIIVNIWLLHRWTRKLDRRIAELEITVAQARREGE